MTGVEIGLISIVAIIALIYFGMEVAVALSTVSFVSVWAYKGSLSLAIFLLSSTATESIGNYVFGVVPLFVLMGLLVNVAGIGKDTFRAANHFLHKVTGGLGIATVIANTAFSSVTGISIASAAVFTKVATPEMLRLGYKPRFAVGVVTGSSVLGMLIPPSLLLIVYALIAEQSVGKMFIAGILPGLLLAAIFCLMIVCMAKFAPNMVRNNDDNISPDEAITNTEALRLLFPLVFLICVVLGGIYGGIFTPTEAGAAGAAGALIIALFRRSLSRKILWETLLKAGQITASISFLIIAASVYSRTISLMGIPDTLSAWIIGADFSFAVLILIYILMILALGTIIDSISIILVAIPIFLPMFVGTASVDPIWFGILTIIAAEIGLLTPPMGLSAYVVKASLDDESITIGDIFIGTFPYVLAMGLVILLIVLFPGIVTALL